MDRSSNGDISQPSGSWSTIARSMARAAAIVAGAGGVGFMAQISVIFAGTPFGHGQNSFGWIGLLSGMAVGALAVAYFQSSHECSLRPARLWPRIVWLVTRAAVLAASAIVVGFFVGFVGLFAGATYGGNSATEFEFAGNRGYEAWGLLGALIGLPVGNVVGALLAAYRLRQDR